MRRIEDFANQGVIGAADPELGYAAPDVFVWPEGAHPAARDLRDSAADFVMSTNGLTR